MTFQVGDLVVVEQLQTGRVVAVDPVNEIIQWRHDEDGEIFSSHFRYAHLLQHGEPRLGGRR